MESLFATITGTFAYYRNRPFKPGMYLRLVKEPDNVHDDEAIQVLAPIIGKVGYLANSPKTTISGTSSAGRLYDMLPEECAALVLFITSDGIIVLVLPTKKLKIETEVILEDTQPEEPHLQA